MKSQYEQLISLKPKPFLKWAGGKRQLLPILEKYLPSEFSHYYEPFLGGGAMFFSLIVKRPSLKSNLFDLNSELVLAYQVIRDHPQELIKSLKNHSDGYFSSPKSYYYSIRDSEPKSNIEKVSRLIFLNRTCFNGLYRINSKGKFNVPLGRYSHPNIVNEENILIVSKFLKSRNVEILNRDFSKVQGLAKSNDFIYFDPPYQPISSTSNFTSYTKESFGESELERLSRVCEKLHSKNCKIMVSNSKSEIVSELFSQDHWTIRKIAANRAINSNSSKRTGHQELLITNY